MWKIEMARNLEKALEQLHLLRRGIEHICTYLSLHIQAMMYYILFQINLLIVFIRILMYETDGKCLS